MKPLVAPGPQLTEQQRRRYSRQLLLPEIGEEGQRRLLAARVLVVGAGGLGSPALLYLAAAGIGTLGVVDDDVVEESNLQRQVLHGSADVGRPKVDSAADAVARLDPAIRVVRHRERLTADNALDLVAGYDLVLDGSDTFATRYLVNDACVLTGTPWVWGAVLRFDGHVAVFRDGHGPTYRDLFPTAPPPGTVPSCGEAGVLGGVCAAVASVMSTEAVKLVTGAGTPLLGRLLVHDALAMSWRSVPLRPDPRRAPVTELREEPSCALPAPTRVLPTTTAAELLAERAAGAGPLLVDVREPDEHAAGAVPGALLLPLGDLLADPARVPAGRVVLHCAAGARSARALDALLATGRADATHLEGGFAAWVGAGGPVAAPRTGLPRPEAPLGLGAVRPRAGRPSEQRSSMTSERDHLAIPDYDHLPVASLTSRIRTLDADALAGLISYEEQHGAREPVLTVMRARADELAAGATPSGGNPAGAQPEHAPAPTGPALSPATTNAPPINPPSHGDPTNPAQPR